MMFITTTLGGILAAVSISTVVGTAAGILIRPKLERTRDQFCDSYRRTAEGLKTVISGVSARL